MSTLTAVRLRENITEVEPTTAPPSVARVRTNLTEKKRLILSNISSALAHDIELTRRAARKKHPHPITASPNPRRQPASPAFELPDYCTYRPRLPRSSALYHPPSPSGRPCSCPTPHPPLRPHQWRSTPAEEAPALPKTPQAKVRFADDPVTEVRVFERWYRDEYVFGDGYWAKGPVSMTGDWSTVEDDEVEMGCAEAGEGDEVMGEIGIDEIGRGRGDGVDGGPLVRMG